MAWKWCRPCRAIWNRGSLTSTPGTHDRGNPAEVARYREPDPEALVEAMEAFCHGPAIAPAAFARGRERLIQRLTWESVTRSLHELLQSTAPATSAPHIHAGAIHPLPARARTVAAWGSRMK